MTVAAILAGGRARRLGGRDKCALRIGGDTFLRRQVRTIAPVVRRVIVVGYAGSQPLPGDVAAIPDRVPGAGPLAGLDAALEAAAGDDVLLLACDMPFVSRALSRHLLALGRDSKWNAVVPRTDRGYHPLCAVYSASCRDIVRDRLARGRLRMIELLGELRVRTVEGQELAQFGDARRLLANVNTDADLAALEALQNH
jgi:molybdopterin-guanine dinucleotide biosynthesis protein A